MAKLALITGSSRGIGRAAARKLAEEGYNIIINYKEHKEQAESIVREIEEIGRAAMMIQADVSKYEEVERMFNEIFKYFRRLDLLVNNAGIASLKTFNEITPEYWKEIFDTNVNGMFNCCKFAVPKMISQKEGVIINVASIWGIVGASCETHYSATKGAIVAFTKALAKELGPSNIRVNSVAPGPVMTDMLATLPEDILEKVKEDTPLNKIATPEEIAEYIYFLASDKADLLTGQVMSPNGGFIIY